MKKLIVLLSLVFIVAGSCWSQDTSSNFGKKKPQPLPFKDTIPAKIDTLKYKNWEKYKMEKDKQQKIYADTTKRMDTLRRKEQ